MRVLQLILLVSWLLIAAPAQESHRRALPEVRMDNPGQPQPRPNSARLHSDAAELAELARSVSADLNQVNRGLLAKDLDNKLRRIEKLAKQLRQQLIR